ncbi:MAG: hypothetical protein KQH63_02400 [Desulfobulbaceae bacterium]|nr:hypothetical protein [Desulfobulbaceae bacterium]
MRKTLFVSLIVVVIVIGLLHFFTPGEYIFFHNTYRRLSYFPIVLGAIWFGVRGGLTLALLSSIAFIPHVLLFISHGPGAYISEMTEIVLYIAAGLVTGVIAGRETRLRDKYRQLSEKLQKSYARLHDETEQLIEAEKQLAVAQKLSALGKLSASLAHEIKNPLSSIRGTAEILLDEFPEGHPKREFTDILLKETNRLNNTVEEVLRFSRQKGVAEKKEEREPFAEIIAHVSALVERQVQQKKVTLILPDVDTVCNHEVQSGMSQVLLNLMLNALDSVPENGTIKVFIEPSDEGCSLNVCDNGPGVTDENKEKIFEPFFTGKEEGTGLGLLISRKIIESYGGEISVFDNPGGGACFRVFLPHQSILNS